MARSNGIITAQKAGRYVAQLAKHWGHRFHVADVEGRHTVDFGDGSSVTMTASGERAEFSISGPAEALAELRGFFEEHLNRFAHCEGELVFYWSDPSAE